ncbi:MAG TPA: transcriptional regulator [Rhodospirillaceae bacterium]|nr:transcriptional regulator [Rhodospirillaceae bacterium]
MNIKRYPNRIREWRERCGLSMQALADRASTGKSQIDKLERGDRRLTMDWMVRLSVALDCAPAELLPESCGLHLSERRTEGGRFPYPAPDRQDLVPVRSAARGGFAEEMHLADGPIDYVSRPHYLAHAHDTYAIYVVGESMVPMYRPGQLLFVNPYKPPTPGRGVVVTLVDSSVLVKEYVRQTPSEVMVREYQPQMREFSIPRIRIQDMHSVTGAQEP